MYYAVSNAIEQCKTERAVDVFQVTKAVRMQKPGAVTTLVITIQLNSNILYYIRSSTSQYMKLFQYICLWTNEHNMFVAL